jgi:transcriptional regulator with XRE-family HTH domain
MLRRARRAADLSQRQLADALGVAQSTIARAEAGRRDVTVGLLVGAAGLAGLRLALLDGEGREVAPMDGAAVRDEAGRHFPAHLDTRHGDEGWWHGPHRYDREPVTYTFTRDRRHRDARRLARGGTPEDHQRPQPGDGLADRAAARRDAARRAREDERRRRLDAGEIPPPDLRFACECPPACDDLDDRSGPPRHAEACACGCDLG